jgi:hypothetical protein
MTKFTNSGSKPNLIFVVGLEPTRVGGGGLKRKHVLPPKCQTRLMKEQSNLLLKEV